MSGDVNSVSAMVSAYSVTCGDGIETRTVVCHNWNGTQIDPPNCPQVIIETSMTCHNEPCPPVILSSTGGLKEETIIAASRNDVYWY